MSPSSLGSLTNLATVVSTTPDPNTANGSSTWTATSNPAVPALSNWALGLLALLLTGYALRFVRKTRPRQAAE
jgi:hypothetical protein